MMTRKDTVRGEHSEAVRAYAVGPLPMTTVAARCVRWTVHAVHRWQRVPRLFRLPAAKGSSQCPRRKAFAARARAAVTAAGGPLAGAPHRGVDKGTRLVENEKRSVDARQRIARIGKRRRAAR